MGKMTENLSINVGNTGIVLSNLKGVNLKDIKVYEETESVQDLNASIKADDIALGLSVYDDICYNEIGASKEFVKIENTKEVLARKVETEAKGTKTLLGENTLLDDIRYEDDQCSVITCDVENFPESPSVDVDSSELSSGQNEDYVPLDCQTPKESTFDPFASGAEELAFAPRKKMPTRARFPLWKKLDYDIFDDSSETSKDDACSDSVEDCLIDFISKSLLELIVSTEVKKSQDDFDSVEQQVPESLKTPTTLPLLTGIAETCPPAPLRPAGRSKLLCKGICRKLDFGTDAV